MDTPTDDTGAGDEPGPFGLDYAARDRLLDLRIRVNKKLAMGRTMQLSRIDLDLMNVIGTVQSFNDTVDIVARYQSAERLNLLSRSGATPPTDRAGRLREAEELIKRFETITGRSIPRQPGKLPRG